ncbi:hypothetical protein [Streptomyces spinosirectus]
MNIGERRSRLGWTVAVALTATVIGVTGCRPTPTAASGGGTPPAVGATVDGGTQVRGTAGRTDGARKLGHVGPAPSGAAVVRLRPRPEFRTGAQPQYLLEPQRPSSTSNSPASRIALTAVR